MNPEEVVVYSSGDGDPRLLDGRLLAVIGYGNLGSSMALNLRDSGCNVIVANIDDEYRAGLKHPREWLGLLLAVAGVLAVLMLIAFVAFG